MKKPDSRLTGLPASLLTFLLLLSAGASAQHSSVLTPEAPPGHYAMGREYIPLHADGLSMELGFDAYRNDHLVFDLVVLNDTPDSIRMHPGDFYYVFLEHPDSLAIIGEPVKVVARAEVVGSYEEELEEWMDARNSNATLSFLEGGLNVLAAAIGFLATDDPGYIIDAAFSTVTVASDAAAVTRDLNREMQRVSDERELVSMELFSDSLLAPGEQAHGYVFFPKHKGDCYYLFCLMAGQIQFEYVYRQEENPEQ